MRTVLYIDGSPLLLDNIVRNANGRITQGDVINGAWKLRLSDTEVYAFEDLSPYGWSKDLRLRTQHEYKTLEEYETDVRGHYNDIIAATDEIRKEAK